MLNLKPNTQRLILISTMLISSGALSGCIAALGIGALAGTTATVVADRRTAGIQLTDENIQIRVKSRLEKAIGGQANFTVRSFNQRVLITGEVPSLAAKNTLASVAKATPDVREVIDQTVVAGSTSFSTTSNDVWISSKVRSTLLTTNGVPSRAIDVSTTRGVVYLMGLVTKLEGEQAASAAAGVAGVSRVVKVFEYIPNSQANQLTPNNNAAKSVQTISSGTSSSMMPSAPGTEVAPSGQTQPVQL